MAALFSSVLHPLGPYACVSAADEVGSALKCWQVPMFLSGSDSQLLPRQLAVVWEVWES